MNIPFMKTYNTGKELDYIADVIKNEMPTSGDGKYTKKVHEFLEKRYKVPKVLLTTSGTTALEFAIRLLNLDKGDEIIVPSFTFSSTANAVLVANELKIVFAEIDPKTMNIDPDDIKKKITKKTKAIIVVHYAGVACDMDKIMKIAKAHNLKVVEDAAQCIEAKYNDRYLGTIGDFGCISFHATKNISCGEGGALFINKSNLKINEQAEILREKGTNRTKFILGKVDKYTWVDIGSSYLPSDILAAYLFAQLEKVEEITAKRINAFQAYYKALLPFEKQGLIQLPYIPDYAKPNGHIFYILFKNKKIRDGAMEYLKRHEIGAVFHYIPLHSAPQGVKLGNSKNDLIITEILSQCLLRLPLYPQLEAKEVDRVVQVLVEYINSLKK